uniref:Lysosomal associated membrane protein family member 5 n=1 Tax=Dromaius novaehollandiae TaxID=8790 RepID=A0A8C4KE40_DRONO
AGGNKGLRRSRRRRRQIPRPSLPGTRWPWSVKYALCNESVFSCNLSLGETVTLYFRERCYGLFRSAVRSPNCAAEFGARAWRQESSFPKRGDYESHLKLISTYTSAGRTCASRAAERAAALLQTRRSARCCICALGQLFIGHVRLPGGGGVSHFSPVSALWTAGKHTASSHRLSAFVTPAGKSYECQAQQTISLVSSDHQKSVELLLSEVRVQPFDISADFVFSEEHKCPVDQREQLEETLPLILGLILGLVIVITLCVYHIHHKLTANQVQIPRDRSQYKHMG